MKTVKTVKISKEEYELKTEFLEKFSSRYRATGQDYKFLDGSPEECWEWIKENLDLKGLFEEIDLYIPHIEYQGHIYWYDYKIAKTRVSMCLATNDPQKYCNGVFLYSDKDPGAGKKYVIIKTTNPNIKL